MILSDLWPGFQGHDIFWRRIWEKRHVLKSKLLMHKSVEAQPVEMSMVDA